MNILQTIIDQKRTEVEVAKKEFPATMLQQTAHFNRDTLSLKQFLLDPAKTGIIAEFKRRSPSRGSINETAGVVEVTTAYAAHGASGLSVLTDHHFFGGCNTDLQAARINQVPILRKDFIIDEYQLIEARSIGADVVLLIAACLSATRVKELASFARSLQLEVLLEIHGEEELEHICDDTELVGVNNRDLKTFVVDIERSIQLSKKIPAHKIKIAESGIHNVETICNFKNAGFHGFLIGENFMKQPDPTIAFAEFVDQLNAISK